MTNIPSLHLTIIWCDSMAEDSKVQNQKKTGKDGRLVMEVSSDIAVLEGITLLIKSAVHTRILLQKAPGGLKFVI